MLPLGYNSLHIRNVFRYNTRWLYSYTCCIYTLQTCCVVGGWAGPGNRDVLIAGRSGETEMCEKS